MKAEDETRRTKMTNAATNIKDMNEFMEAVESIKTLSELKELYHDLTVVDDETGYEDKSEANPRKDFVHSTVVRRLEEDALAHDPEAEGDYISAANDFLDRP